MSVFAGQFISIPDLSHARGPTGLVPDESTQHAPLLHNPLLDVQFSRQLRLWALLEAGSAWGRKYEEPKERQAAA